MSDIEHKSHDVQDALRVASTPSESRKIKLSHVLFLYVYYVASGVASFLLGYLIYNPSFYQDEKKLFTSATHAALVGGIGSLVVGAVLAPFATQRLPPRPLELLTALLSLQGLKRILRPSPSPAHVVILDENDIDDASYYLSTIPFGTNTVAGWIGYAVVGAWRDELGLHEASGISLANARVVLAVGDMGWILVNILPWMAFYYIVRRVRKPRGVEKEI